MKIHSKLLSILMLGALSACHPPKSPVVRPLEIKNQPIPKAEVPAKELIKIGVRVEVDNVAVGSDSIIHVTELGNKEEYDWGGSSYAVSAKGGKLYVDGESIGEKVRLRSVNSGGLLQCRGLGYRGDLILMAVGDKVTVINELGIDEYLMGVLPREVVVTWHEESLKVQAVASRTYLASHLGSHSKQGFDLCSEVHCQVYGGAAKEHPRTTEAVRSTKGQILVYENQPIGAFFHSNCGGSTEEIKYVWGPSNRPFLPRKKCSYGTADPRYNWKISFSDKEILDTLKSKSKVSGAKLKSLRIIKKSLSGRAERILVSTDEGSFDLSGNEFRIAMHPERIRSTLFTSLTRHGAGYQFQGRGWGHGVGMCQWGAKGQAEQGRDYRYILEFYYPHTNIQIWSR